MLHFSQDKGTLTVEREHRFEDRAVLRDLVITKEGTLGIQIDRLSNLTILSTKGEEVVQSKVHCANYGQVSSVRLFSSLGEMYAVMACYDSTIRVYRLEGDTLVMVFEWQVTSIVF